MDDVAVETMAKVLCAALGHASWEDHPETRVQAQHRADGLLSRTEFRDMARATLQAAPAGQDGEAGRE